ncbi:phytoene desaturase family protein [Sandaracinus amylolyticus]|uniref:Neurosporene desaturase n=1 Tax=Sandaracinus amylolyticus TaxID=927083 RepID=A0A0F6SFL1_9BACT|nr:NAD(P)-binding protein [Sandaracinus amylolyticus]AKF07134.1 Neurosporene desaturase [Sandaracinus amylolyticus]
MIRSFYDVVVVGSRLGGLSAAALLAKRGFRVLVLGQDDLGPTYELDGEALPRAPFSFLSAHSPVARRVFAELAITQAFRRQAAVVDPAFQVALPGHRLDLALDPVHLDREIDREFPEVKRPALDFLARARATSIALDRAVDRDLVWPPETFFERREHARAISHLAPPPDRRASIADDDPLRELPDTHPFRLVVHAPVRFADGMDPDHGTALRLLRHFSSWREGGAVIEGGAASLRALIESSLRAHGGELRARDKIDAILVKRGNVEGVRIAASGEEIGASFVLLGSDVGSFLRVLPDRRPFEELFERVGEPVVRYYRYTLNLHLRADGVPAGMARDVFFVRDPSRPLSGANLLHVETHPADAKGRRLLCVEALLPRRGVEDVADYLETIREHIVASLGELVPFLGSNLVRMDSPHDGRPAQDLATGTTIEATAKWARGRHTMDSLYGFPIASALGVCALPVRTPIKRLLLCNAQVVPGLGLEGQLLAAWSAARIVSRSDRRPAILRRGLWTKLES